MHYHIIGTDHKYQTRRGGTRGLFDLMEEYKKSHPVVLIAEEVDADAMRVDAFGKELIGPDRWLSIDMTEQERRDAGIYDVLKDCEDHVYHKAAQGKRENHWLDKIQTWCAANGESEGTVIITCGLNHVPYLRDKAIDRKHTVTTDIFLPPDYEKKDAVVIG
jgi:hypothetical protein